MTYSEFQSRCDALIGLRGPLRKGQLFSNLLNEHRPELAKELRGMRGIDPFYLDGNLLAFWDWLRANWERLSEAETEREACALIAEDYARDRELTASRSNDGSVRDMMEGGAKTARKIAEAIRARGKVVSRG